MKSAHDIFKTPVCRRLICALLLASFVLSGEEAFSQNQNAYFDSLAGGPGVLLAKACRSQQELNDDAHGPTTSVVYDSTEDAARAEVSAQTSGDGDAGSGAPRYFFDKITTGKLWYVFDMKIHPNWPNIRGGVNSYKMFQLASKGIDSFNDQRRLEIRNHFSRTSAEAADPVANPAGAVDTRPYHTGGETGSGGKLEPINADPNLHYRERYPYIASLGKWNRYWAVVDFDNKTYSLWAADEDRNPVTIYDKAPVPDLTGLSGFWWEFDTSQSRNGPAGVFGWFKNLVVLHNVTPPFVRPVGGVGDSVAPAAPENLRRES